MSNQRRAFGPDAAVPVNWGILRNPTDFCVLETFKIELQSFPPDTLFSTWKES